MTNASTSLLLVDTNILVYAYDPADKPKQAIAQEILTAPNSPARLRLSVQVLGEAFNTLSRRISAVLTPAEAEQRVTSLSHRFNVLSIATDTVRTAVAASVQHQMSYWDALVWATAKLNGISVVLTEDIQSNGAIEGVTFVDPFAAGFDMSSLALEPAN